MKISLLYKHKCITLGLLKTYGAKMTIRFITRLSISLILLTSWNSIANPAEPDDKNRNDLSFLSKKNIALARRCINGVTNQGCEDVRRIMVYYLATKLNSDNHSIKRTLTTIKALNMKELIPELVTMLQHRDLEIRRKVLKILIELGWEPQNKNEEILYHLVSEQWEKLITYGEAALPYMIELVSYERRILPMPAYFNRLRDSKGLKIAIAKTGASGLRHLLNTEDALKPFTGDALYAFPIVLRDYFEAFFRNDPETYIETIVNEDFRNGTIAKSTLFKLAGKKYKKQLDQIFFEAPEEYYNEYSDYLFHLGEDGKKTILRFHEEEKDRDDNVKRMVIKYMKEYGKKPVPDDLLSILADYIDDETPYDPLSDSLEIIADTKTEKAKNRLRKLFLEKKDHLKFFIAYYIAQSGDRGAIPLLVPCLYDKNSYNTYEIASALKDLNWEPQSIKEKVYFYAGLEKLNELDVPYEKALPWVLEIFNGTENEGEIFQYLIKHKWIPENDYQKIKLLLYTYARDEEIEYLINIKPDARRKRYRKADRCLNDTAEKAILQMGKKAVPHLLKIYKDSNEFNTCTIVLLKHLGGLSAIEPLLYTYNWYTYATNAHLSAAKSLLGVDLGDRQDAYIDWWEKNKEQILNQEMREDK